MFGRSARFRAGAFHVDTRADLRGAIKQSFVDYRWELDGRVRADRVVRPGVGLLLARAASGTSAWTAAATGAVRRDSAAKAGVRLEGVAGAVELFAGCRAPHRPLSAGVWHRHLGHGRLPAAAPGNRADDRR